jgi:DNA end-binding protein Ku
MHAMWSGSLSFGLVNVPVRIYSATREQAVSFDLLHSKDMSPIRYAKVCKSEGEEVPKEEIVKGYEYQKGEYVILSPEDFEQANPRKTKAIEVMGFAEESEIDSLYYEKPYYLEPEKGADKAYAVLREALRKSQKVAIARHVLGSREHLAAIKPSGDILILNQLRFSSEVREPEGLRVPEPGEASSSEVELALLLIDRLTQTFDPSNYKDTYSDELMRLIEEKAQGRVSVPTTEEPQPTKVVDLMAMLKQSLENVEQKAS